MSTPTPPTPPAPPTTPGTPSTPATPKPPYRAGLVALVGRTNAGKSTLLNALVGSKVSIVTPKPQTTRDAIHGIVHRPHGQIVFVDTPGFFHTRKSRLVSELHERTREALTDVDVVVHLVDPTRAPGPEDALVATALAEIGKPRLLCLGKADAPERPHRRHWREQGAAYTAVLEVSGLTRAGLPELVERLIQLLPESEPLYPETDRTNASRDFQIAEIIREQVYLQASDELPYRTRVSVDKVETMPATETHPERLGIDATVFASDDRYQRMLIGRGGQRVKQMREFARRQLQRVLGTKVALSLDVRVDRALEDQ